MRMQVWVNMSLYFWEDEYSEKKYADILSPGIIKYQHYYFNKFISDQWQRDL